MNQHEPALDAPAFSGDATRPVADSRAGRLPALLVEPPSRWPTVDWRGLWSHRDLLLLLAWRDIKVRYQQTLLGVAWAVLQPLLTTIIFTLLFGKLARVPSDGAPYAIFAYAALLPWNLLSGAITNASSSLVGSANLITKVYFPRLIIPSAALGAPLLDCLIAALILFTLMPCFGAAFSLRLLMLAPLLLLTLLLALGGGLWAAALNVKYRDVRYALPFVLQLWMYATPIIYPLSIAPQRWRWILELNPLSGIIQNVRDAVFNRPFHWHALAFSSLLAAALLLVAIYVFQRMESEFADIV